jgi:hypothetical protein
MTELTPSFDAFRTAFDTGKPQIVARSLVADLDTPVSAWMKLGASDPYSFLFESVQGGELRGRYSIIGLKPDIIWRCRGAKAELNLRAQETPDAFAAEAKEPLASLRDLITWTRMELPPTLPPMASGLFGYLGHDMVRLMERLPAQHPDPLGLPDAVLVRPTVVAIFDAVRADVTIATPVFPQASIGARQAYDLAEDRLSAVAVDFARNRIPEDAYAGDPLLLDGSRTLRGPSISTSFGARRNISRPATFFRSYRANVSGGRSSCRRCSSIVRFGGSTHRPISTSSTIRDFRSWDRVRKSWSACAMASSRSARSPEQSGAALRPPKTRPLPRSCLPIRKSVRNT